MSISNAAADWQKYVGDTVKQYEPADPYYEHITDTKGRKKRVKVCYLTT